MNKIKGTNRSHEFRRRFFVIDLVTSVKWKIGNQVGYVKAMYAKAHPKEDTSQENNNNKKLSIDLL